MELDELRREIVKAARKVNTDAFNLLRWGITDAETDTYTVPAKFVRELAESRMKLKEIIDKYDMARTREKDIAHAAKRRQRVLDEEMGFREPCLTIPDDSARGWEHDMCGNAVHSAPRPSWATDYNY